jgi:ribosomal protein S18 acetylase RimI-like enzyme
VSPSITIQLAQPADCPSVVACVREAYQPYIARIGQQPAPVQANYAELIARHEVYVLREASEPSNRVMVDHGGGMRVPTATDASVPAGAEAPDRLDTSGAGSLVPGGAVDVSPLNGLLGVLVMRRVEHAMFIENVAVRPGHQGQGLGRRLMAFAEEAARTAGLSELRLYTNELMLENVAFYCRLGYVETARRLDAGFRRVFMRKTLA